MLSFPLCPIKPHYVHKYITQEMHFSRIGNEIGYTDPYLRGAKHFGRLVLITKLIDFFIESEFLVVETPTMISQLTLKQY